MKITPETVLQWYEQLRGPVDSEPRTLEEYLQVLSPVSALSGLPPGTRVLVRGDVDAGFRDEIVVDDIRLRSMRETLQFGIDRGWVQIIFGHRGRDAQLSLKPVRDWFANQLQRDVVFIPDWMNDDGAVLDDAAKAIAAQAPGSLVLLENTRRYALERSLWKASPAELPQLAVKLARLLGQLREKVARVEVNEGFSASNPDVSSALAPAAMDHVALGFYLDGELRQPVTRAREAQFVIFSGLKIEKLSDLEAVLQREQVRIVLAAGSLAMALNKAAANLEGKPFSLGKAGNERCAKEKYYISPERIEQAQRIVQVGRDRGMEFVLPVDFVLADGSVSESIPPDGQQLDVGPKSSRLFEQKVGQFIEWHQRHQAETGRPAVAFHNGVFGRFEDARFEAGTRDFIHQLKRMYDAGVEVYVGGGEGGAALEKYGDPQWVSHVFTAGGTILKALGTEPIPYLKAMWLAKTLSKRT